MLQRVRTGLVAGLLVGLAALLTLTGATPSNASTVEDSASAFEPTYLGAARVAKQVPKPLLTPSAKQVEEGDRIALTAAVRSPKTAGRVTLEKWYVPLYVGTPSWQTVKTLSLIHICDAADE